VSRSGSAWFLYGVAMFGQMCAGIVGIAVPIYAYRLGASPFLIGAIGASGGIAYSFMPVVFGKISDRLVRSALISVAMASYGFVGVLYALCADPQGLIFIKVVEGVSLALFWPTLEALVADTAGDEAVEEALTKYNLSWGTATIIGPMVGGLLISGYTVKTPFYFSSAVSFSISVLAMFLIDKTPAKQRITKFSTEKHSTKPRSTDLPIRDRNAVLTALMSIFLFAFVIGILTSLFPAFATELGIPAHEIGLIMLAFGLTRTIVFSQAMRIEARFKKAGMFLSSSIIFFISSLLTTEGSTTLLFTVAFAAFGVGAGASYSASLSFVLREWGLTRGYAAGIFESIIGFGYFVGSLAGGTVSEISLQAPYLLAALVSIVVCFAQLTLSKRSRFKILQ